MWGWGKGERVVGQGEDDEEGREETERKGREVGREGREGKKVDGEKREKQMHKERWGRRHEGGGGKEEGEATLFPSSSSPHFSLISPCVSFKNEVVHLCIAGHLHTARRPTITRRSHAAGSC